MRYLYTNEPIRKGDRCIFIWQASRFGEMKDDAPKGKPGETVYGSWLESEKDAGAGVIFIPMVVEKADKESLWLRPFRQNEDGSFSLVYGEDQVEPLSLQIMISDDDKVFPRLIKTGDWLSGNKAAPAKKKITIEGMEELKDWLISRGYVVGSPAVANGLRKMADYFDD